MEKLTVQAHLIKAENKGLRQTEHVEKMQRRRGKPLFHYLRDMNDGKAIFYSPSKIQGAQRCIEDQARIKEQKEAEKAEERRQKQLRKEENQRMVIQRRQQREQKCREN